ncbi:hypothetical protein DOY81_012037 [Sarcophaga bullata]|nr:hypothetical protein DOY81_012037 [Sarcophaga bullata]
MYKTNYLTFAHDYPSDLKLLHNVLRLGGRLDPQFSSFKTFEEKFKLPDAKELVCKRVDLEEYFCKRERLADYCKAFRLRRYCHQYESMLPLVKEDRYKINLDLWREKQNVTNSESSSVEYVTNQQRGDEHIKDTQELFEEYCRQKRKEHLKFQQEEEKRLQQRERELLKNLEQEKEIIYNIDDEVAFINETPTKTAIAEKSNVTRDNSEEPVLMSPLLVESDSDADDLPQICNDSIEDIEIVDLSSEEKDVQNGNNHNCSQDIMQSEEKDDQNGNNHNCSQVIVQPSEKVAKIDETTKESDNLQKKSGKKRRFFKKRSELDRLEEDIVDTLKLETSTERLTRRSKAEVLMPSSEKRKKRVNGNEINKIVPTGTISKSKKLNEVKQNQISNKLSQKASDKNDRNLCIKNNSQKSPKEGGNKKESTGNGNCTKAVANQILTNNSNSTVVDSNIKFNSVNKKVNGTSLDMDLQKANATTPDTFRKIAHTEKPLNTLNKTSTKVAESKVQVKKEAVEEISPTKRSSAKDLSNRVNSEKIRLKRELEIAPAGIHNKLTRSMKRLTRSAGGSKYLTKNLSLQIDKIPHPKKKMTDKLKQKTTDTLSKTKMPMVNRKPKVNGNNTQTSVISHRSSQDYESIQCAQRLSESAIFNNAPEKTSEFLVPNTPNTARNSLLPSSLTSSAGFFAESDVVFVPPSNPVSANCKKPDQVILLSSSDNENSTSQSSSTQLSTTSRRTRALKPRRVHQSTVADTSKVPSFSELLAQQNTRSNAKSPDLFSNCSDLIHLPCTQPQVENEEPNMPFEGFKIFGSEVKQLQQHYAFTESNNSNKQPTKFKKSQRDQRSCLEILEKMFEPQNKRQKLPNKEKSNIMSKKKSPRSGSKPQAPILPSHPIEAITETRNLQEQQQKAKRSSLSSSVVQDDDIFEITNNGTFGSVMRLHSNGDISPVHHAQKTNAKQHNKITNYLIGNSNQNGCSSSQDEVTPNSGNSGGNAHMEAGTPSKRSQMSSAQNASVKKSPKGKCSSTQATKLTKWFTKPSDQIQIVSKTKTTNSKKTSMKHIDQEGQNKNVPSTSSTPPPTGKRILKRRRLDLSFTK